MRARVYFSGGGPGDPGMLTLKGKRIIEEADIIIYADSLVPREVLKFARKDAVIYGSASMTLEQITDVIVNAVSQGRTVARLQSGDPSIYGAIAGQMRMLDARGIAYEIVPGVSSLLAAAALLRAELTVPGISQTVIITRLEGKTPVPRKEDIRELAKHQASMAVFLSAGMVEAVVAGLLEGGYPPGTPAAVVYRAGWPDEKVIRATVGTLVEAVRGNGITRQALILVGEFLNPDCRQLRSRLYSGEFGDG
ncbi:MAG: precorrin-4 C(11)-methyltransferase [Dehalococcoidales bacterium]|nr:precorrin-4 C(11)-methyltransferase [Dehalococcoidales bacterium]